MQRNRFNTETDWYFCIHTYSPGIRMGLQIKYNSAMIYDANYANAVCY